MDKRNNNLKHELDSFNSAKSLESIARNNLKMAGKNEILLILNADTSENGRKSKKEEKPVKEIDVESLDAELAAARTIEENKNTIWGKITAVFAFCMSVFHILTVYRPLGVIPQRGIHTAFAFTILFLSMPQDQLRYNR